MIRRSTLILGVAVLAAAWLGAGAATPARATSPDDGMRASIMALRGIIDREGGSRFFVYPTSKELRPGAFGSWWPPDPWTGGPLQPGQGRGTYSYSTSSDRRHYRLIGHLGEGRSITVGGSMPEDLELAFDHRGEEGLNLIRQYVEDYAATHDGLYPLPREVSAGGAVGTDPVRRYWPSNPWDHAMMRQQGGHGSFTYAVADDRRSYTLRLHRALKHDYVLTGATVAGPWQQLLNGLQDVALRQAGAVLAGYVDQWAQHHSGALPSSTDLTPDSRLGAAHPDWPRVPGSGVAMHPGRAPGDYTYVPGASGAYKLVVHLHSGDFTAGGIAPSASQSALDSGPPES
jgi:hypothetical protein